jgi:hypothetical protein
MRISFEWIAATCALVACGAPVEAPRVAPSVALATPAVTEYVGPPRGHGAMPGVRASRMAASLSAAGLDIANLPPLETLAPGPKQRVMRTFSEALGLPCVGCHAEDDFTADTRRKRVTKRMWNEIVRVLRTTEGGAVYCDSCHDGAMFHLDRHDTHGVAAYMSEMMVDKLARIDGRPHDCTTCHGDPPDFFVLATWKKTPAPNIALLASSHPNAEEPPLPMPGVRAPESCGIFSKDCPLQRWMRYQVSAAAAARDAKELVSALDGTASWKPDADADRWVAIAKDGARAAERGDIDGALASCRVCHDAFKVAWRERSRMRTKEP